MQVTAQGYLIFELTQSPAYLGYVGFANGLPAWVFMLVAGVVADRMPRRKLILFTQVAMMALAFLQAGLTFTGHIQPWHILLLALLLGTANAFDVPARQSFVLEMVDREDLTNAIALNGAMFNLAVAVGPAVGGLTYALVGPAWCFTLNGVSFLAFIGALLLMRLGQPAIRARATAPLDDLKEGLRFVAGHAAIRSLIIVTGVMSLFGMTFITLLPAWAVVVLGGDAQTNGLLLSARGLGALAGAIMIASLGRFNFRGRLLTVGTFVFPGLLLVFALVRWLPLALLALVGVGWGFMILFNVANALVQTLSPDELRGRVVSVYTLNFFGLTPIGALLIGSMAEGIGEPASIFICALICLACAGVVWWRVPSLRALA